MDDSQDFVLNERSQKCIIVILYLYEVREQAKSMECDKSTANSHILGRIDWAEGRTSMN